MSLREGQDENMASILRKNLIEVVIGGDPANIRKVPMEINYCRDGFCESSSGDLLQPGRKKQSQKNAAIRQNLIPYLNASTKRCFFDPCKGIKADETDRVPEPGCGAAPGFWPVSFSGFLLYCKHQFLVFQSTQKSYIILIIDQNPDSFLSV
jgi:hypothetical protein